MRISKFTLPALTVAGALALAGCGGGSDGNGNDDPPPPPPGTAKTAEVPDDGTVSGDLAGFKITLAAGETKNTSIGWLTCESGTCSVDLAAGTSVSAVPYTGTGTLTIRNDDHRSSANTGAGTPQPTEDTSPLSQATLFKAITGSESAWTANDADPLDATTLLSSSYEDGGKTTRLSVRAIGANADNLEADGAYIYWGLWDDSTQESGSQLVTQGGYGAVMGGGTPYGKKPEASVRQGTATVTSATYTDTNPIVHFREDDDDTWRALDVGNLTATLRANFRSGMIGGRIGLAAGAATELTTAEVRGAVGDILLRDAPIGSDGTFSGTAEAEDSKRQSGGWNGGFFGGTSEFVSEDIDGTTIRSSVASVPSHAAATFSVRRPDIPGTPTTVQDSLTIRGAFGAPDS